MLAFGSVRRKKTRARCVPGRGEYCRSRWRRSPPWFLDDVARRNLNASLNLLSIDRRPYYRTKEGEKEVLVLLDRSFSILIYLNDPTTDDSPSSTGGFFFEDAAFAAGFDGFFGALSTTFFFASCFFFGSSFFFGGPALLRCCRAICNSLSCGTNADSFDQLPSASDTLAMLQHGSFLRYDPLAASSAP